MGREALKACDGVDKADPAIRLRFDFQVGVRRGGCREPAQAEEVCSDHD